MSLILKAETNTNFLQTFKKFVSPIKPVVKYSAYALEGNILTQQVREHIFGNTQPAIKLQTPKLNLNQEQLDLDNPAEQEEKKENLDFIFQPLPQAPQLSPAYTGGN